MIRTWTNALPQITVKGHWRQKFVVLMASVAIPFLLFGCMKLTSTILRDPMMMFFGSDAPGRTLASFAASLAGHFLLIGLWVAFFRIRGRAAFEPTAFGRAKLGGWITALTAAGLLILIMLSGPIRGQPILEASTFNLFGSLLAGPGYGTSEELLMRGILIALLAGGGFGRSAQVLLSGLLFGLPHVAFGFLSGTFHIGAALGAIAGTTVLGSLFAAAYLMGGRSLIPCITAHALLNVVIEPWLVYSAMSSGS